MNEVILLQAIPGMLLSLVLCFDHRKFREHDNEGTFSRGNKYIQFGGCGYAVGMIAALAAGLLSQAAQPALLYLVRRACGSFPPYKRLTVDHVVYLSRTYFEDFAMHCGGFLTMTSIICG